MAWTLHFVDVKLIVTVTGMSTSVSDDAKWHKVSKISPHYRVNSLSIQRAVDEWFFFSFSLVLFAEVLRYLTSVTHTKNAKAFVLLKNALKKIQHLA